MTSLRRITADTVRTITALRISPQQVDYVATNAESIAEAYFHREAWFRAICAHDAPVGFVMLNDRSLLPASGDPSPIGLGRFMIDHRYQRAGYGRAALQLVVDHVRARTSEASLVTSDVPGPHSPEGFYVRSGFRPTGEVDGREVVLELPLLPRDVG